jgi:hypothetical protein
LSAGFGQAVHRQRYRQRDAEFSGRSLRTEHHECFQSAPHALNINHCLVITPSLFNGAKPTVESKLQFLLLGNFSFTLCSATSAAGQTCTPENCEQSDGKTNFDLTNTPPDSRPALLS